VRAAVARQALVDCEQAESLLQDMPDPPAELRERIDTLKARVAETGRGIDLVLALDDWRSALFDANGTVDREAAARRCRELFAARGTDFTRPGEDVRKCPGFRAALADWLALSPDEAERDSIGRALESLPGGPSQAWVQAVDSADPDRLAKVADSPSEEPVPAVSFALAAGRLLRDGKAAHAERLLARGVRQHPRDFILNARLAAILRAEGKVANAIRYLNAAHAARPGDRTVHRELGLALADANRPDEAIETLRAVVQSDPKDAAVHARLGELYLAQGDADAARASFTAAVGIEPANGSAQIGLARAELGRGDRDAAAKAFEAAARSPARAAAAHAGLGKIHLRRWEASKAVAEYRAAVATEPINLDYRLGLIEALRIANDPTGRLNEARAAAAAFPRSAVVHRTLGDLLAQAGDPAGAAAAYRRALVIEPGDSITRRHFARCLADRGDEAAVDQLNLVVDSDPESGDVRAELGHVLCQLGHFRAAATALREAAERFPADSPDREAARAAARSATRMAGLEDRLPEITAGGVTLTTPAAWAELGEVCRRMKQYAAAARFFTAAAADDPQYTGQAAKCAALAGFGRGTDARETSDEARAEWRKRALAVMAKWPDGARDPALAGLRAAADALPAGERQAWQAVWSK
jgi:tetratricopeptide (TPR) repeat protein